MYHIYTHPFKPRASPEIKDPDSEDSLLPAINSPIHQHCPITRAPALPGRQPAYPLAGDGDGAEGGGFAAAAGGLLGYIQHPPPTALPSRIDSTTNPTQPLCPQPLGGSISNPLRGRAKHFLCRWPNPGRESSFPYPAREWTDTGGALNRVSLLVRPHNPLPPPSPDRQSYFSRVSCQILNPVHTQRKHRSP